MHVILFGPRRLHLSLFCHTLCLLDSFILFSAIDGEFPGAPLSGS